MNCLKPGRVFFLGEGSFKGHTVHLVLKQPITQSHLPGDVAGAEQQQVLQVGVEEGAVHQGDPQSLLHDEPHRAVVWETDQRGRLLKPPPAGPWGHLLSQLSTQTKPCSSSGKPEPNLSRPVVLQQLVGSDGVVQAGLAHVDVPLGREGCQQGQEGSRVHIVIIIYVAQPPLVGGHEMVVLCRHLTGQSLVAVVRWTSRHYHLEASGGNIFILPVCEDEGVLFRLGYPSIQKET